jgi:hypothetical protein
MTYDDYDYYNSENIEELYNNNLVDDSETYYDNGVDEPWMNINWENYYHNLTDELDE